MCFVWLADLQHSIENNRLAVICAETGVVSARNVEFVLVSTVLCCKITVYLNIFFATNNSNGVGSHVLATLVTTLPLHIQI